MYLFFTAILDQAWGLSPPERSEEPAKKIRGQNWTTVI